MFADVPMIPFLFVTGVFLLVGVWVFYLITPYLTLFLGMVYIPIFVWMREVTKKDDQRLHQMLLRARMRGRQRASRMLWGAIS